MNTTVRRLLGLIASVFALAVPTYGTTTLVMNMDVSNGFAPPGPPSHVRVPPGETVVMTLPDAWSYAIQWTKNGVAISGATSRTLAIASASSGDSATYGVTGAPFPFIATGIALDVVPSGHLGNTSSRMDLTATGTEIAGFVVAGTTPKRLLYRVVGPTLTQFGVTNPAKRPVVTCYDSAGHRVTFVHTAMVIDLNTLFQSLGAFPISSAELPTLSFDYGTFQPGAYTLHVSDSANAGGTALVEVYEMP